MRLNTTESERQWRNCNKVAQVNYDATLESYLKLELSDSYRI